MASAAGWYPDPTDPATSRYWDGAKWTDPPVDGVPAPSDATPATAAPAPVPGLSIPKLSTIAWLFFAGCAVAFIGTLMPWERDTTALGQTVTQGPTDAGGGLVLLLALLAAFVWAVWPAREGPLPKRRLIAATVLAAVLSFFVFAKLAALGDAQDKASSGEDIFGLGSVSAVDYGAGAGLVIYSIGLVAIWVGLVKSWLGWRNNPA